MAMRKWWGGVISIGMLTIPVEAVKATGKYAGNDPLKDLCSCHHKPLDRGHRCVESGTPRGELSLVKGVEKPDGSYGLIDPNDIAKIEQAIESPIMEVLAIEDVTEVPLHEAADLYWLRTPKKQPGWNQHLALLYRQLVDKEQALVGKITQGRQYYVAVYARDGKLCMSRLRYPQEMNTPDGDLDLSGALVAPELLEQMNQIAQTLPTNFDLSTVEDESVKLKAQAIASATSGQPVTTGVTTPEEPSVPDLMSQLKASVDALDQKKAKKKAPAKARTKETA